MCFICQTEKKDPKSQFRKNIPLVQIGNLDTFKKACELWHRRESRPYNITAALSMADEAISNASATINLVCHRHCRSNFLRVTYTADDIGPAGDAAALPKEGNSFLRSKAPSYDKDTQCVICCSTGDKPLRTIKKMSIQANLHEMSHYDFELMTRLECQGVKYHSDCYLKKLTLLDKKQSTDDVHGLEKVMHDLKNEIEYRTCRGQAVLVSDCWARFRNLCIHHGVSIPSYFEQHCRFFKYKIVSIVPNVAIIPQKNIEFEDDLIISSSVSMEEARHLVDDDDKAFQSILPAYNDNEMLQMTHVALYLRGLVLQQKHNTSADLSEETAYASVPEAL